MIILQEAKLKNGKMRIVDEIRMPIISNILGDAFSDFDVSIKFLSTGGFELSLTEEFVEFLTMYDFSKFINLSKMLEVIKEQFIAEYGEELQALDTEFPDFDIPKRFIDDEYGSIFEAFHEMKDIEDYIAAYEKKYNIKVDLKF